MPLRRYLLECPIINPALSLLMNIQSLVSTKKLLISRLFIGHHGILVSIGQHFVTTKVLHLPKRTETSLITEADLITKLDQAVRAVHSCNSWFEDKDRPDQNTDTFKVFHVLFNTLIIPDNQLARIAQSAGHLTCKPGVLGSIPGLASYFRFSFH